MIEFTNAHQLADVVSADGVHVAWAPGDSTVYRVGLIRLVQYGRDALDDSGDVRALLVTQGTIGLGSHLLVEDPGPAGRPSWTAKTFLTTFEVTHAGWWAGVRPLLAALGWTPDDDRDVRYRPGDADVIARYVNVIYGDGRDDV